MQRLALFDLDNTLIDRDEAFARWAAEFAGAHDLPADASGWLIRRDNGGGTARDRFFADVRAQFGLEEPTEELWRGYRETMPWHVNVRPEVLALLEDLRRQGWRLAIATNGRADNQLGKIRRTGLAAAVDGWAVSGALGVRKPDRALFAAAAAACGLSIDGGGWMVGDNPDHDIAGGRAAGLRTIWISRGRAWAGGEPGPDHTCAAVEAAAGLIVD
ncbi:HAD family hydrolase [Dactylosporangium sp. NPDC051541]|uniref:HAD family hydrolase n=1 Tax=Dactylosporangium sp. NPDC051541 TaxID=3363977 RepID=UPI0037BA51DA